MNSKFESGIRQIDAPQEKVYETLSNLQNLERVKDRLPEDKLQNLVFDNDSIGIEMAPVGKIAMRIIEREEPQTIKFESVESPYFDPLYIAGWCLILTFAGLLSLRIVRRHVHLS